MLSCAEEMLSFFILDLQNDADFIGSGDESLKRHLVFLDVCCKLVSCVLPELHLHLVHQVQVVVEPFDRRVPAIRAGDDEVLDRDLASGIVAIIHFGALVELDGLNFLSNLILI